MRRDKLCTTCLRSMNDGVTLDPSGATRLSEVSEMTLSAAQFQKQVVVSC